MTRMSFSHEIFELYKGQYAPAPWHADKSPEILVKMLTNASDTVNTRLTEYRERIERTEPIRLSILRKYMQSPI